MTRKGSGSGEMRDKKKRRGDLDKSGVNGG